MAQAALKRRSWASFFVFLRYSGHLSSLSWPIMEIDYGPIILVYGPKLRLPIRPCWNMMDDISRSVFLSLSFFFVSLTNTVITCRERACSLVVIRASVTFFFSQWKATCPSTMQVVTSSISGFILFEKILKKI